MNHFIKRYFLLVLTAFAVFSSCEDTDLLAPELVLNGADSVRIKLNALYEDEGATATDDTEGDISTSVFVDNPVNTNMVGIYEVSYSVTDKAGNEANPLVRIVTVYNEAEIFNGTYDYTGLRLFPSDSTSTSVCEIYYDSVINNRINLYNFCLDSCYTLHAEIADTIFTIPTQLIGNSFRIQGFGSISDTLISSGCTYYKSDETELWDLLFIKSEN